jgi:transcriptional regulator with XRE-family HTH domain
MTQAELAQASGLSRNRIVKIEGGQLRHVRLSTVRQIAKALGTSVAHLLER